MMWITHSLYLLYLIIYHTTDSYILHGRDLDSFAPANMDSPAAQAYVCRSTKTRARNSSQMCKPVCGTEKMAMSFKRAAIKLNSVYQFFLTVG
ncbi:hypothetical protein GQ457_18G010130 [Hibiscus cannabinus]